PKRGVNRRLRARLGFSTVPLLPAQSAPRSLSPFRLALISDRVGKLADPWREVILPDLRSPAPDHSERKGSVGRVAQIYGPRDSDRPKLHHEGMHRRVGRDAAS